MTNNFYKSELTVLDIIAHNNWERPIYFDNSAVMDYPYLKKYLQNEGHAFRLLPVSIPNEKDGWVNTDIAYKNLMEKSSWRNTNNAEINQDQTGGPFVFAARIEHYNVAVQLMREGQKEKAKKILLHSLAVMPDDCYEFDHIVLSYAPILFDLKENKTALQICNTIGNRSKETLVYLDKQRTPRMEHSFQYQLDLLQQISKCLRNAGEIKAAENYEMVLEGWGV
jgi:tetratricopeptide (TPR) repeat protein